jgi:hypothetical protein
LGISPTAAGIDVSAVATSGPSVSVAHGARGGACRPHGPRHPAECVTYTKT